MSDESGVRKWLILATFFVGLVLVALAVVLDVGGTRKDIWPSVLLEVGTAIGLAGVLFVLQRNFVRAVRIDNQAMVERVAELIETVEQSHAPDRLTVDVLPTATDRGQEPKILVRITDPAGDYRTRWSVTLRSPSGHERTAAASWPGAGRIFRVRFPTKEPRAGRWTGIATRNGTDPHNFEATVP